MHELALAGALVEIACRHAAGRRVRGVQVKVGQLRQVVPSALAFSFTLLAEGTPLEGAELELESIPAAGVCRRCGSESTLEAFPLQCRRCGSLDMQVVAGEELSVESLDVEAAEQGVAGG